MFLDVLRRSRRDFMTENSRDRARDENAIRICPRFTSFFSCRLKGRNERARKVFNFARTALALP